LPHNSSSGRLKITPDSGAPNAPVTSLTTRAFGEPEYLDEGNQAVKDRSQLTMTATRQPAIFGITLVSDRPTQHRPTM
jgi:hypothetical protein